MVFGAFIWGWGLFGFLVVVFVWESFLVGWFWFGFFIGFFPLCWQFLFGWVFFKIAIQKMISFAADFFWHAHTLLTTSELKLKEKKPPKPKNYSKPNHHLFLLKISFGFSSILFQQRHFMPQILPRQYNLSRC